MNDLPQNWEELIEEISKKRRSERDKNKIKEMKTETKELVTEEEYFNRIVKLMMEVPTHLDAGEIHSKVKDYFFK